MATESALANVFGSDVSLAELNGDVASALSSRQQSVTSEHMATRRRRRSISRSRHRPRADREGHEKRDSVPKTMGRFALLFAVGVGHCQMLHYEFPSLIMGQRSIIAYYILSGIIAAVLGVMLPHFDIYFPEKRSRGKGGENWASIVRALAGFLGMLYAVTKLSNASVFWGFANPCLWYVADATRNGFVVSAVMACAGAAGFASLFPELLDGRTLKQSIGVLAWIAASYFNSSIVIGNLSRRLVAMEH